MFIKALLNNNPSLANYALEAHHKGIVYPDSYIIDLDCIIENAKREIEVAEMVHVRLYGMLKQLGRNPIVAKEILSLGFDGMVAVDASEALLYIKEGLKLGNVGHLVQIPTQLVKPIVSSNPEIVTVYSLEKTQEIDEACKDLRKIQKIMLKVVDRDDVVMKGQQGGFLLEQLPDIVSSIRRMNHVSIGGVCGFPCFSAEPGEMEATPTHNAFTVKKAADYLCSVGYSDLMVNMASVNCTATIPLVAKEGGTHAEPGHGLTGTTPLHVKGGMAERIGYVYLSEISHNWEGHSFCYGGGYYRRGHATHALIGANKAEAHVFPPKPDCIDYYFELNCEEKVGEPVLMCFRTQMFTTRSRIVIVKGLSLGTPEIVGTFRGTGERIG